MPEPSRPPTFKNYGVKRHCYGCGRPVTYQESLWFVGGAHPAVFAQCCFHIAAKWEPA